MRAVQKKAKDCDTEGEKSIYWKIDGSPAAARRNKSRKFKKVHEQSVAYKKVAVNIT